MKSLEELQQVPYVRGHDFVRSLIAQAVGGAQNGAVDYARQRWGAGSRAANVTKAVVNALWTGTPDAVSDEGAAAAFFAVAMQGSIVGKLQGIIRVPVQTRTLTAARATAHWVAQGATKPLSPIAYTAGTLGAKKIVAMTVATMELLENTSADAENSIRQALTLATTELMDASFIDPTNAGVADVEPASVTNGVTPISATASPAEDLRDLIADFDGDLDAAYFVMSPNMAASLVGAANPNIGARGGALAGVPVITSRSVPAGVIALIDPTGIALALGEATGRATRQGAVLMQDTGGGMASSETGSPSGPIAANLVSLFQTNTVALLAERVANWAVVRSGAVSVLTGAAYNEGSP